MRCRSRKYASTAAASVRRIAREGLSGAALVMVGGCMVGPNYHGPPQVDRQSFSSETFVRGDAANYGTVPPPARWWEAVDDPLLTRLIEDSYAANSQLKMAQASIRSARAQVLVSDAKLLPQGGADVSYTRARIPTDGIFNNDAAVAGVPVGVGTVITSVPNPLIASIYSAGFDALWELDVFGGARRGIESAEAAFVAQQAAYEDVQVQLAADVARDYIQLREAQERVRLAQQSIALRAENAALTQQRRTQGTATAGEVEQIENQSARTRAELPALQFTVDQQLDSLAFLTGRTPGTVDEELAADTGRPVMQPLPPAEVPVGKPGDLLRNRPDIRRAERLIASRNATIGTHVADYFPQISLLGILGYSGTTPRGMIHNSPSSAVIPSLSWNLFNIPSNKAKVRGAEADRDQAAASYERTVLAALQDANDALARYGRLRQSELNRREAWQAASRAVDLTRRRTAAGSASRIDLLEAERNAVAEEDQLVQARSQLTQAYVAIQKSLGLGWNNAAVSGAMLSRVAPVGK